MTLSNIFFGKKVVQKAYLNNALIYESKGWQTLPSTCTEVWTKNYEKVSNISAIVKDEDDSLYIGAGNTVYKIDSDGNLKWKCVVGTVTAIVVFPTYIYCSDNNGDFLKIDINGNLLSNSKVASFLPVSSTDYIYDMKKDDDTIYATTNLNYLFKLNSNLAVIDNVTVPTGTNFLAINNGPYVFAGSRNFGTRFDKNNFKNSTSLSGPYSDFTTISTTMDNVGNLYLGTNNFSVVLKYDVKTCKLLTTFSSSQAYALCTDNQENCYMACPGISLKKVSSDGTLIWDNVQIPTTINSIKVITDSNGNIYVAYIDSNSMLTIRKLINLVKET